MLFLMTLQFLLGILDHWQHFAEDKKQEVKAFAKTSFSIQSQTKAFV
jgi:hypothetical protein